MIINHNLTALNTHRQMGMVSNAATKSMERLSSGLRINKASDDAAGLTISEKMRSQIRGLEQASRNAQDGISLLQTAEGALNEQHNILQRMRELVVQAANDTNNTNETDAIQAELDELIDELNKISERTEFNGQKLLDGTFTGKKFQTGANDTQQMEINLSTNFNAAGLGVDGVTAGSASFDTHVAAIDNAITTVSKARSEIGAKQNRLEYTINNLKNTAENLTAAESRIRDVDMAKEMMEFTKNNILTQAAQAMLAQANQQPQAILQLLR